MTNTNNHIIQLRTLSRFIAAIGLFFAFIGLFESYNVGIAGETSYPFAAVNENPWYYQTPAIYTWYNLITGLLSLASVLLTVWAIIKKDKQWMITGIILICLFCIAQLISSKITAW